MFVVSFHIRSFIVHGCIGMFGTNSCGTMCTLATGSTYPLGNLPVIQYSGQFSSAWPCSLHAKVHVSVDGAICIYHRSQALEMVNILQFFSIHFHWQRFSLVDRCFATLIFRPLSVKTFCHDSSLFWVSVLVMSIIARSSAYGISHGSSVRTSWYIVSTSMMNRNGISAEPRWRPIPTSKCSLIPRLDITRVVACKQIS